MLDHKGRKRTEATRLYKNRPSQFMEPTVTGSKLRQALLFKLVLEYGSSVARVDSRTQESHRGRNGLSCFGPIDALRPATDDPYTQKHIKSEGYNRVVERFGRRLARC